MITDAQLQVYLSIIKAEGRGEQWKKRLAGGLVSGQVTLIDQAQRTFETTHRQNILNSTRVMDSAMRKLERLGLTTEEARRLF